MSDVFISYSVKDEKLAQFIHSHLVAKGLSVFLASISLKTGEHWTSQIITALRSSQCVCFLASKEALKSDNVKMELGGAVFSKKPLIPIMWDVDPSELPRWISDFQGLTLKGQDEATINLQIETLAKKIKAEKNIALLLALAAGALLFFSH